MAKKKNNNPMAKAPLPVAAPKKKAPARKPKAKASVNSQLKTTILSAPRTVKLDAARSFMRTTAFTLQNKVRTAMTELSKVEKSSKTPSARLGLSYDSSIQPTSSQSFFANPFNRFKIAFLTVIVVGGVGGYFYMDRVIDGFKSLGDAFSTVSHEKNWVEGMMTQANGIPEDDDKDGSLMPPRMMEETVMPVADEAPTVPTSTPGTDILPTEPIPAPESAVLAPAPVAKAASDVKASKAVKKAKKSKAARAKAKSKAKARSKSKSRNTK
jgi:hypothetical protein